MTVYVVDTNVIVIMNRHMPRDIYEGPWSALEQLVTEHRLFMPREVLEELSAVDDECAPWAKSLKGFIVDPTAEEIACVAQITAAHPDWVQDRRNRADPWLVAHAKIHGRAVVTDERMKGAGVSDANLAIPNVAKEHSVRCLTLVELGRQEGWRFQRV